MWCACARPLQAEPDILPAGGLEFLARSLNLIEPDGLIIDSIKGFLASQLRLPVTDVGCLIVEHRAKLTKFVTAVEKVNFAS